ncbi:tyrosine-type recombinase/integrase [Aeromonas jandaei]|nr:tyrosine-type recombinase/integrase [Aeromonas jandaei]MBL0627648.1 tyrosine-type recombinase/integrase [Aeromonas jandaei]MBW3761374.1 tyrosine-type recombinase/integrase [Aeromonas jandaei]QWL65940.1 tyrosine-type recombinase/integrase [Aeromonas jandaei]
MTHQPIPLPPAMPLFDNLTYLEEGNAQVNHYLANLSLNTVPDAGLVYELAVDWLLEQRHSENNYKTYRSELTTFLHWCFCEVAISPKALTRRIMMRYLDYCQSPPEPLIAYRNVAQFVQDKEWGERLPNPQWRPFLGKKELGQPLPYRLSEQAMKTKLAILSAFFQFLIQEEYMDRNPALLLQRVKKPLAQEADDQVQAFSELQWSYVLQAAETLAQDNPEQHERSRFLVILMYACYLRISEVAARPGFTPVMGQFRRDSKTGVWGYYIPSSKGGKRRTVAVSQALLHALERYRAFLGLSPLPAPNEQTPLFIRHKAAAHGREQGELNANLGIRQLRELVQAVITKGAELAELDGFYQDGAEMRQLTPHAIRHTGITHDINLNGRPLSHVQADAGHDSIDTTSKYLHTSQSERHESAQQKPLDRLR